MKGTISRFTLAVILACMTVVNALAENSTRTSVDLPAVAGYTLEPGKMYIVQHTMTITATAGNGLNVAAKGSKQAPILYIPAGVTLTVKGANGSGMSAGGAGIFVPTGAELIITGAGTLNATGGNAGNGTNGANGQNGGGKDVSQDFVKQNDENQHSGAGGAGGNGGGGAGAGIGGQGGQGGQGGAGGAAIYFNQGNNGTQKDGAAGGKGGNGAAGVAMGNVYVMGSVTVTANSGNQGTQAGTNGTQGWTTYYDSGLRYIAGAGGGGAGGGAGYAAAYGIGSGGKGAGGGAGGGSGAIDQVITLSFRQTDNCSGRATSGKPGTGIVTAANPSDRNRDTGKDRDVLGVASCPREGGVGGNGGAAGADATTADNGFLYVASNATVNGTKGSNPTGYNGTQGSVPTDMQITITFYNDEYDATANNGATNVNKHSAVHTETINIGDPLPAAAIATYKLTAKGNPTATQDYPEVYTSDDKYFAGYYTEKQGLGTRIYKGIGTTNLDIANTMLLSGDVTLYAHFTHVHHVVNWDYTYAYGVDGSGTSLWHNLNYTEYLKQGKLTFYGHINPSTGTRDVIKSIVMQAYSTNKDGATEDSEDQNFYFKVNPTAGAQNHTRAVGNIYLHATTTGTEEDQLSTSGDINVYFTDDQLVTFGDYVFEPWKDYVKGSAAGSKPANWSVINLRDEHTTVYSYTGAHEDNDYIQKWEVTLTGLKVYPDRIFVKPLYWDGDSWEVISQLAPNRYDGETSFMTSHVDNPDPALSSATYTGGYPVWIGDASGNRYTYKVGLVGFTLDGHMYYMGAEHGAVNLTDMVSPSNTDGPKSSEDGTGTNVGIFNGHFNEETGKWVKDYGDHYVIKYTKPASDIPVLRLMPNGGTLSATTPAIIVNSTRTGSFDLSNYSATLADHKLTKWTTNPDGSGTAYATNATVTPGSQALTLYAQWAENIAPVISTKEIDYSEEGADVIVAVSDNVSSGNDLNVQYIVSATPIDNIETQTNVEWTHAEPSSVDGTYHINTYDLAVRNVSYAYVYIKATDAAENTAYASSGRIKIDNYAPTYAIYPERNVCNFYCEITVQDNIALDKIYIKHKETQDAVVEWTDVTSNFAVVEENQNKKYYKYNKPTNGTFAGGTGWYSLKVTDVAGNETVYENFVHMIYDHNWDVANPHKTIVLESDGTYTTHTYYDCLNGCEHVWDETVIGAAPNDPDKGYKNTSTESDPVKKQHQEQGLMRAETLGFLGASGTVVITNTEGYPVAVANTINEAIGNSEIVDGSKIILADNTNVGSTTIATPAGGKNVTIDLDGYGLKVGGEDRTITGNANVTILLNDNGGINYTNGSTVTNTPIAYKRNFAASTRVGKWQALYLPFAVSSVSDYELGTVKSVSITSTTAELKVLKGTTEITANSPYFIRSNEGTVNINVTSGTLKPYTTPSESPISENYTIKGSLTDTDNAASADKAYWVLTNGGAFTWAKAGSHQRPYHWVIYDKEGSSTPAKALSMIIVEEEATGINAVNKEMKSSNAVYTLDGRKVNNIETLAPGMYIIGSKKVVIK